MKRLIESLVLGALVLVAAASGCGSKYNRDLFLTVARTNDPLVTPDYHATMNLDRSQVWRVEDGAIRVNVADLYDRLSGADFWFEVYPSSDVKGDMVFRSDTLNVRQVRKWALQDHERYEILVYAPSKAWLRQVERGRTRVFKDEKAVTE